MILSLTIENNCAVEECFMDAERLQKWKRQHSCSFQYFPTETTARKLASITGDMETSDQPAVSTQQKVNKTLLFKTLTFVLRLLISHRHRNEIDDAGELGLIPDG